MTDKIERLIQEAQRIEEDVTHSGKRHHNAADRWSSYHYWVGLPAIGLTAVAGGTAFADYPLAAGMLAAIATCLTAVFTFLKPERKATQHRTVGTAYFTLKNQARMFREIECLDTAKEAGLAKRLRELADRRDSLNEQAPQTSHRDFERARAGIEEGEQTYRADRRSS